MLVLGGDVIAGYSIKFGFKWGTVTQWLKCATEYQKVPGSNPADVASKHWQLVYHTLPVFFSEEALDRRDQRMSGEVKDSTQGVNV